MRSPRDLADRMTGRNNVKKIIRETQRMPATEARRHAKQIFEEFPSAEPATRSGHSSSPRLFKAQYTS
jgi:hypothetical protein